MTPDREKVVVFNDTDMPDDAWLDWYHAEFPAAEFRRSPVVERGTALVMEASLLHGPSVSDWFKSSTGEQR